MVGRHAEKYRMTSV